MITLVDDKLNRAPFLDNLFKLFENFGNQNGHGLTIVINGKYGVGKSTLFGFIEERNAADDKFNILRYNTWENNLFDNPMIPILYSISKLESKGKKIKGTAISVLKNIPKALMSTLAGVHGVDVQPLFENESIFDEYDTYKDSIAKFKNILTDYCAEKKTILLVDELDRCLPEYQIKVLESLYHLLDIPNLIVVIALDREQLEEAIKVKFGEGINLHGYLAKFIQYEIDLDVGDTYTYMKSLMAFSCTYEGETKNAIANTFKVSSIPIRECLLLMNDLNLILNERRSDEKPKQYYYWYPILVTMLLILKRKNNLVYRKYFNELKDWREYTGKDNIPLADSTYGQFLNDIKGSSYEKLLSLMKDDGLGSSFLIHFINVFLPISGISIDSLSTYVGRTIDSVEKNRRSYEMWEYPEGINKLITKLNAIF